MPAPLINSAEARARLASAILALLLQAAFILAFLHAFSEQMIPKQLQKELIFVLPPLPRVKPVAQPEAAPRQAARPVIVIPPPLFTAPPPASAPALYPPSDLQNFGQALLGCAPETYANLTPQQKALCARPGEGMAIPESPASPHVKDEARWAAGLAERNTPVRVPCTYLETQSLGPGHESHSLMLDPICTYNQIQRALGH